VTAPAVEPVPRGGTLAPAFTAARKRWLLVALLFAVAIVGWTMGFGRRKPPEKAADADRDPSP